MTDKKESHAESFTRVEKMIEDILRRATRKELFNKLVGDLKLRYRVEVSDDAQEILSEGPPKDDKEDVEDQKKTE
ncbi:hypothetical protein ACFL42_03880 [Candidatus Omnitrophota bacterium]